MHYTVTVIHSDTEEVKDLMEKFNENRCFCWVKTREEHIAQGKKDIEGYKNGLYARYLSDKDSYKEKCKSENHWRYVSEEFPKRLLWSESEILQEELRWYKPEQINKDGSTNEYSNRIGKWDWFVIGGRWNNQLKTTFCTETNSCKIKNLSKETISTHALLLNGEWIYLDGNLHEMLDRVNKELNITLVDCHS